MKIRTPKPRLARLGLVGLSGYAEHIAQLLAQAEPIQAHGGKLAAMYVPDPQLHRDTIAELSARGVRFHNSYPELLADDLTALWLPVPIHLHRPMTEAALQAGVQVMCEKPVAATIDDARAMLDTSRLTGTLLGVGFQNLYEPATHRLKQALLGVRSGPLHAVVTGGWPRGTHYYERNDWAGCLRHQGSWVLDGPAGNAMAHFINLAAFLLGTTPHGTGAPTSVTAELYRANDIESYDTFSARVTFADGSSLTAVLTHACERETEPTIRISGEGLQALWRDETPSIQLSVRGETHQIERDIDARVAMAGCFAECAAQGDASAHARLAAATLEASLTHTTIVNGAIQSAPIHTIPASSWTPTATSSNGVVHAIHGIEGLLETASTEGKVLHELGDLAWTKPPHRCDLAVYRGFLGPKRTRKPLMSPPAILPAARRTLSTAAPKPAPARPLH